MTEAALGVRGMIVCKRNIKDALRSTSCEQLRVQTRRTLVWKSTSVGRWTMMQESIRRSRRSISSQAGQ
ncbi:hypothetical protein WN55_02874 [Dufourea novaeangliae]|uniref:Uncharacterized protein n=1 Tax=Dufourea novaeangliae TaxID=178035 RepID=A0A154PIF6_DUFNO|nr:hypothetical protein WN55_02874 [Dufourea novaeangliae]